MDLGDPSLKPIKVLGTGTFGRVFLCKYRNNQMVCVKRIIVQNPKQDMKMIMEEVYIISQVRHPNIIQFIGSFVHSGTVNIIMEYAANGTLMDIINQSRAVGFSIANILRYFCDILMGLEYLHIRHVFHRDLKPANLLIDLNDHIQIADFGISLIHSPNKANGNAAGTAFYSAPEVLRGDKYDYKSDVWSLGCILYEMCVGHSPFSQAHNMDDLVYLIKVLTRHKLNCSFIRNKYGSLWANLCEQMITTNLQQRISLPEVLSMDPALTIPYYNKYFDYKY
ncbi:serine/threonine-protein kinase nekl-2 [Calliphora vicina]|uniref:serine/threonine-protein kinase nekl-2 n=1 Tax=Calliphora vicina TaxID=7373 RepID=UPI00325A6CB8